MSLPTVASLCRALGAHLRPADGFAAPETEVSAVHVSERSSTPPHTSAAENYSSPPG